MGELLEKYKEHAGREVGHDGLVTDFEHKYIVTAPPLTQNMQPRTVAKAPMVVRYATRQKDKETMATIVAKMEFKDALCLFAAIGRVIFPEAETFLTEQAFLHDKLEGFGMKPIEKGNKNDPSVFSLTPDFFQELAGKDFRIEGVYHGKPPKMWYGPVGESKPRTELRRVDPGPDCTNTDEYYLENIRTANPEEIAEHIAKLEKSVEEWQKDTRVKRLIKQGLIGFS